MTHDASAEGEEEWKNRPGATSGGFHSSSPSLILSHHDSLTQQVIAMLIAGNWKMNTTLSDAVDLAKGVVDAVGDPGGVDVAVCPPFVSLDAVFGVLRGSPVRLGAQNLHFEEEGAYTGEVSAAMLKSVGCHYAIIGHSERRQYFGETDAT